MGLFSKYILNLYSKFPFIINTFKLLMNIQKSEKYNNKEQSSQQSKSEDHIINDDQYQLYKQMVNDLEFIQLLSNPRYVVELSIRGYFYNPDFVRYIERLKKTFFQEDFLHLIRYPEGLINLEIMTRPGFSDSLKEEVNRDRFILMCLERNKKIMESQL